MLNKQQRQLLAQRLYRAYQTHTAISPLSEEFSQLESTDSYAIQEMLVNLIVGAQGQTVEGFKLGFTSAAMRQQMNVAEANFGFLLPQSKVLSPVDIKRFIHPRVEPEIAVFTKAELSGKVSLDEIAAASSHLCAAIEIVDSRFQDYRFKAEDNIADNSSAAGYALGKPVAFENINSPEKLICRLLKNRQIIAEGLGSDAMGGPLQAVQWLVEKLSYFGRNLPSGSVVMTGGLSRAELVQPGDLFAVEFSKQLGSLELEFQ